MPSSWRCRSSASSSRSDPWPPARAGRRHRRPDLGSRPGPVRRRPGGPDQRRAGGPVVAGPAVPPLQVDAGLARRRPGVVGPPRRHRHRGRPAALRLRRRPAPTQVCVMAANSGDSGNGFWPGDGSDGMEAPTWPRPATARTCSTPATTTVGVGVTCSGGQAWTVELFGYAYGDLGPGREPPGRPERRGGRPGPGRPVGGRRSRPGDPVYCPGQTVGPNGADHRRPAGSTPTPTRSRRCPASRCRPPPPDPSWGSPLGRWRRLLGGPGPTASVVAHGDAVRLRLDGRRAPGRPGHPHRGHAATAAATGWSAADGGIFAFGDAALLRLDGRPAAQRPGGGHGARRPTARATGWSAADGGIFAFGDAGFYGSMGGQHLNAPVVGMAADPDGRRLLAGRLRRRHLRLRRRRLPRLDRRPAPQRAGRRHGRRPPTGQGYWLVGSDGGIFAFGDAPFQGQCRRPLTLNAPVVGMAADPATGGYWLVGGRRRRVRLRRPVRRRRLSSPAGPRRRRARRRAAAAQLDQMIDCISE